jgi:cobalt-zinc-cadmium efflux system protein
MGSSHQTDSFHAEFTDRADDGRRSRMALAVLLTGGFMVAEFIGGWLTGSLALMADAAHMLSDAGALALALGAMTLSRRPADDRRTYGLHRLEVLAAFVNGLTLLVLAVWIVAEAIPRITHPEPVLAGPMMTIAVLGLLVNLVVFRILSSGGKTGEASTHAHGHGGHGHGHGSHDLNTRAALAHVLGDLLGSAAAILAAGIILVTGWTIADPLLSILVAGLVARSALAIVRESAQVLVEGTPPGLDVRALGDDLAATLGSGARVHHLHAWSLTPDHPMVTFHVTVGGAVDPEAALATLKTRLEARWAIRHSVIQVERGTCPDLDAHPRSDGHDHHHAQGTAHPGSSMEPVSQP